MKGKKVRVKIADLKRHRIRTRQRSPEDLKALALSWLETPYHEIICGPDMTVGDGNGRLDGLALLGETEVDVLVLDEDQDEQSFTRMGFVTAYHREGLGQYEQALAIKNYKAADAVVANKDVAKEFKIDPAKVTRALSLFTCISEVIKAAEEGRIGESDWYAIHKLPPEKQPGFLAMKMSGASRNELEQAVKDERNKPKDNDDPPAKTAKVKIPLATEAATGSVTVAGSPGEEIDLEGTETILKEALKAVRSAREKGLSVRSAQGVWRDMAATG